MAIRMNRNGETIFGKFASGDLVLNLSRGQEELLIATGDAFRLTEEEIELALTSKGGFCMSRALTHGTRLGRLHHLTASALYVRTSSIPNGFMTWTNGDRLRRSRFRAACR